MKQWPVTWFHGGPTSLLLTERSLGETETDEFVDTFISRDELIACWDFGWQKLIEVLSSLSPDDLAKTVAIRGEPHSVPLAIQRSLAHTAYTLAKSS